MSSTPSCSEILRMIASEEQLSRAGPSLPSHKRADSKDFVGIGGHFRHPTTQTSEPRPSCIDEPLEDTSSVRSKDNHEAQEQAANSGTGPVPFNGSQNTSTVPSPPAQPKDNHCISEEAATHLTDQRDALRERKKPRVHRTESSASDTCESPRPMSEDDFPSTQTPRDGNRTPVNASRPATPPHPSVATSESGYDSDGKGPISPQPWSTAFGHKRMRSDDDDIYKR